MVKTTFDGSCDLKSSGLFYSSSAANLDLSQFQPGTIVESTCVERFVIAPRSPDAFPTRGVIDALR
jgi:hypothetical protein